ncbi:sclerostin domain-containing protein 1b [Trichomycterus rosablanca]|uniref:sclerostin domain-containing protein 1b n=1 Tax=Trichomycterus rosablanca TaxID=2290929 RepID=UPI002F3515C0
MVLKTRGYRLLFYLCVLMKSCCGLQNGATEHVAIIHTSTVQETLSNVSLNRARSGSRRSETTTLPVNTPLGCRELRSTKYISDGHCTSVKAVKELVCAGECVPAHLLPNWIGGGYWARRDAPEWRCVNESTRTQRVKLRCKDGSTRTYKVAVVTSCTCKRYTRQNNESALKSLFHQAKVKKRGRKNKEV